MAKTTTVLKQNSKSIALTVLLVFTAFAGNGCQPALWNEQSNLSELQKKPSITVLTVKSPLTYSKPRQGEAVGIDNDLLESFAEEYGLNLKYRILENEQAVLEALGRGEGDMAAARLRVPSNNPGFLLGPAYEESHLSLYCTRSAKVQNISDLDNKLVYLSKYNNRDQLSQKLLQLAPRAIIKTVAPQKTPELLKYLSSKNSACAITENLSGDFHLRYYKRIEKVIELPKKYSIHWLIHPSNSELFKLTHSWFLKASRREEISKVYERYDTHLNRLDKHDVTRFLSRIQIVLPTYKPHFQKYARENDLSWELVAAVAYQESHWNNEATSFTGVKGLMQLTQDTAKHLGVEDRTDPVQSIYGGALYLRKLMNLFPKDLNSKDKLSLALAAYNIGYAHLLDAQELAVKMGKNPYSWRHLKNILPLLADPDYSKDLKYGYARGYEAVEYVERVKSFYSIISSRT